MSDRSAVYRLALETGLGARTVTRVLRGESVRESTRLAVVRAAKRLRVKFPPVEALPVEGTPPAPEAA